MKKLIERPNLAENVKAAAAYQQLGALLNALEAKALPTETVDLLNKEIEQLNTSTAIDKDFLKATKKTESSVIKLLEKKHKIVPKDYYKKLWMVVGMSAFGMPLGVAFGLSIGNIGMLAIGLPIGMAIGIAVGASMDKKAFEEGRQLELEVK